MQQYGRDEKNEKKKKMIMRIGFTLMTIFVIGISYIIINFTGSLKDTVVDIAGDPFMNVIESE